jgi:membrane protein DedA with SNARE-associated domain
MSSSHIPFLTYPAILVAVFARQMYLPVPAVLFLIMAGALGERGRLSLPVIILTAVADLSWFHAGRIWGSRILGILCSFSADSRHCAQRARDVFARWGLHTLMVAKFIPGLDGVMPPLSGMQGAAAIDFLLFDTIGALLWASAYCLIGYIFADRVDILAAGPSLCVLLVVESLGDVLHGAPTPHAHHFPRAAPGKAGGEKEGGGSRPDPL